MLFFPPPLTFPHGEVWEGDGKPPHRPRARVALVSKAVPAGGQDPLVTASATQKSFQTQETQKRARLGERREREEQTSPKPRSAQTRRFQHNFFGALFICCETLTFLLQQVTGHTPSTALAGAQRGHRLRQQSPPPPRAPRSCPLSRDTGQPSSSWHRDGCVQG